MARGGQFEELVTAAAAQLTACTAEEGVGCFASDPVAYADMMGPSVDAGVERTILGMAAAATAAGASGIPLEQAMYTTWELAPDDEARRAEAAYLTATGRPNAKPGDPQKLVDGPQARIVDHLRGREDRMAQIVNCAYLCGTVGVANCPVLRAGPARD